MPNTAWFNGAHEFRVGPACVRFVVRRLDAQNVTWRAGFRPASHSGPFPDEKMSDGNAKTPETAFDIFVRAAAEAGVVVPESERAACLATLISKGAR